MSKPTCPSRETLPQEIYGHAHLFKFSYLLYSGAADEDPV